MKAVFKIISFMISNFIGIFISFLVCMNLLIQTSASGQCDSLKLELINTSCKVPFIVKIIPKGVPKGSICRIITPSQTLNICGEALETINTPGNYQYKLNVTLSDGTNCTENISQITLKDSENPSVNISPSKICNPPDELILKCTDSGYLEYKWNITGIPELSGNPVKLSNPKPGIYEYTLKVIDKKGCMNIISDVFSIPDRVILTLVDSSKHIYCNATPGFKSKAKLHIIGKPGTRKILNTIWNKGDGEIIQSSKDSSIIAFGIGERNVTARVIMEDSCEFLLSVKIKVVNNTSLKPKISPDTVRVCKFQPVYIINETYHDSIASNFSWNRSSNNPQKLEFIGDKPGIYKIILTYKSSQCVASDTSIIEVVQPPMKPKIKQEDFGVCKVPHISTFQVDTNINGYKYRWLVKDHVTNKMVHESEEISDKNYLYTFTQMNKWYDIYLETVSPTPLSCKDTIRFPYPALIRNTKSGFFVGNDTAFCVDRNDIKFNITSNPDEFPENYRWSYRVPLISTEWVDLVKITNSLTFSFIPKAVGPHQIRLVSSTHQYCPDTSFRDIVIYGALMKINAETTKGCEIPEFKVDLNSEVLAFYGDIPGINYEWLISKDSSEVAIAEFIPNKFVPNPTLIIREKGIFSVALITTTTGPNGAICTTKTNLDKKIHVGIIPTISDSLGICPGSHSKFTADYKINTAQNQKWSTDPPATFITPDTSKEVYLIFEKDTTYKVCFNFQTDFNPACNGTICKNVTVKGEKAAIKVNSSDTICPPVTIAFEAMPKDKERYEWDFGDGKKISSSSNIQTHLYQEPGKYDVSLKVVDKDGCISYFHQKQYIKIRGPQPKISIDMNSACSGNEITFINDSKDVEKIYVDYGDGVIDTLDAKDTFVKRKYTFPKDNKIDSVITVKLVYIAVNNTLCKDIKYVLKDSFLLYRDPEPGINSSINKNCSTMNIDLASTAKFASKIVWYVDEKVISEGNKCTLIINLDSAKFIKIKQIIYNSIGCEKTLEKEIFVPGKSKAKFSSQTVICKGDTLEFINNSTSTLPIRKYFWNFGNGDTTQEENPIYLYKNAGKYNVTLTLIDSSDCKSDYTLPITVNEGEAFFETNLSEAPDIHIDPPVNSINIFSQLKNIKNWYWNFGNGEIEIIPPFTHQLDTTSEEIQNLIVKLRTINTSGCEDTFSRKFLIKKLDISIPNTFTPNNDGINDFFKIGYNGKDNVEVQIFNRWGALMNFQNKEQLSTGWDGKINGFPAPEGVYYYIIKFGNSIRKGSIVLLR